MILMVFNFSARWGADDVLMCDLVGFLRVALKGGGYSKNVSFVTKCIRLFGRLRSEGIDEVCFLVFFDGRMREKGVLMR